MDEHIYPKYTFLSKHLLSEEEVVDTTNKFTT